MAETAHSDRIIKKSSVYFTMLVLFLSISSAYGYTFYNPAEIKAMTNSVVPNGPPAFNRMVYGGFEDEALNKPMDVVQIGDFIYVTDTNNQRVQVFELNGTPAFKFGQEGSEPGQFKFPYGISGDSKGNIYVADLYKGCISIHDNKGKFIKYFAEESPSEKIIDSPGGLRISGNKLYVTDIRQNKVFVFDTMGKKLMEVGKLGVKPGEFRAPNAVTVDTEGNIYVSDSGNQRVQVFDKSGKFLRIINGTPEGKGPSAFVNPRGIAIDSKGRIFVISNLTHFIYCFDKDGKEQFTMGGYGDGVDKFTLPNGLFINENDEIFVTDTLNGRISIFD